ncbi:hypothetical protein, partial [Bifidobacterium pseudolongum]|uniref:VG15 protein n=1 Tax=Bifidobacterium pseudolongum TaxID=1694 RepID=UPI00101F2C2D
MTSLNNLQIRQENRKPLLEELDRLYKSFEDDIENLAEVAAEEMELAVEDWERQELVLEYTREASVMTNSYYEKLRRTWEQLGNVRFPDYRPELYNPYETLYHQVGGFSGTDWNGLNFQQIVKEQSKAGVGIDSLWPDLSSHDPVHTVDEWQQFIGDMVHRSVRDTTMRNSEQDPTHPRWARVPHGAKPCAFCIMLASRGFVYHGRDTAEFGSSFHNGKCRCTPVCSWGKDQIFGYNQQHYLDMWNTAKAATNGSKTDSHVLEVMRRKYHNDLRDGVISPKKRSSWKTQRVFSNMRSEQSLSRKAWNKRQSALGIPVGFDELEMHEIVTMERFKAEGNHFKWIPRLGDGTPTNDFHWAEKNLDIEMKGTSSKNVDYSTLSALLRLVCKDVFELAAVDEASLDVAGGVGEAHGVAAQGLEPAV